MEISRNDVNQTMSEHDVMFQNNNNTHYFSVGESALRIIESAIGMVQAPSPKKILDFGAGAGRVTRWLMAAFPKSQIHACDVRDEDMNFLQQTFGIQAWTIDPGSSDLRISERYDLIWVGSVITHLPANETRRLVGELVGHLEPGGLLICSFHGRYVLDAHFSGTHRYIDAGSLPGIVAGYNAHGYGYADYPGQSGYGNSVTRGEWMIRLVESLAGCRLALISERVWDNHHDIAAIQLRG